MGNTWYGYQGDAGGSLTQGGQTTGGPYGGMTLRDYFAAQALPECISIAAAQTPGNAPLLSALFDKAAAYAYYAADAMLKART